MDLNKINRNTQSPYLEIAVLQSDINKYRPGKAEFLIPALSISSGTFTSKTSVKLDNKNSSSSLVQVTTSDTITLEIPKDLTRFFSTKIIKKGTRFIVGFIGGDITTARIIASFDRY